MWIKVKQAKHYIFYKAKEIVGFGKYDYDRGGMVARIKDENDLIEIFLPNEQLEELFEVGDIKMSIQLLEAKFTPQSERQRNKKILDKVNRDTETPE
jgi:hypothetical protein